MGRLLACLLLAAFTSPAVACINDEELPSHEREFRSHYRGPAAAPVSPSTDPDPHGHRLLLGAGAGLLVGATGLALAGNRRRK